MLLTVRSCLLLLSVHPGVTDSSWYKKADNEAYLFSWIISRVRAVAPFIGVGQPTRSGAISSIYVSRQNCQSVAPFIGVGPVHTVRSHQQPEAAACCYTAGFSPDGRLPSHCNHNFLSPCTQLVLAVKL